MLTFLYWNSTNMLGDCRLKAATATFFTNGHLKDRKAFVTFPFEEHKMVYFCNLAVELSWQ